MKEYVNWAILAPGIIANSMAKAMLERGIISEKDYDIIDRLMAEKYGISLSSIFFL